jgi:hypothetical protein
MIAGMLYLTTQSHPRDVCLGHTNTVYKGLTVKAWFQVTTVEWTGLPVIQGKTCDVCYAVLAIFSIVVSHSQICFNLCGSIICAPQD